MSSNSAIEWTDATWNPTVGCSIVSPGCTNCYAMKVADGLQRRFNSQKYAGLTRTVNGKAVWTGEVRLDESALLQPLKWRKPKRIFVNSMSDLFHEAVSYADIDKVFDVMSRCPQHTFQVLTKRAERMRQYFHAMRGVATINGAQWPLTNVWLGVSAERQEEADERIPHLLQTPAAVRFVSAEPLLGPIDLSHIDIDGDSEVHPLRAHTAAELSEMWGEELPEGQPSLDWIIVGGESGPRARAMHPQWARDIRDQCAAAGVAFFFKQWGEWAPMSGLLTEAPPHRGVYTWDRNIASLLVGKKAAGRLLDGREHNEFPRVS